jgi:hypothetical protein
VALYSDRRSKTARRRGFKGRMDIQSKQYAAKG